MEMETKQMDSRKLDESGVDGIFDIFDDLKDKIKRIEVGVGGLLKAFLTHKCFEPIVARPGLSGRLYLVFWAVISEWGF